MRSARKSHVNKVKEITNYEIMIMRFYKPILFSVILMLPAILANSRPANPNGNKIYEIRSIPTNFLIDGNGVILATNLRGEALEQMVASLKK